MGGTQSIPEDDDEPAQNTPEWWQKSMDDAERDAKKLLKVRERVNELRTQEECRRKVKFEEFFVENEYLRYVRNSPSVSILMLRIFLTVLVELANAEVASAKKEVRGLTKDFENLMAQEEGESLTEQIERCRKIIDISTRLTDAMGAKKSAEKKEAKAKQDLADGVVFALSAEIQNLKHAVLFLPDPETITKTKVQINTKEVELANAMKRFNPKFSIDTPMEILETPPFTDVKTIAKNFGLPETTVVEVIERVKKEDEFYDNMSGGE
jgi:hypothetical protein